MATANLSARATESNRLSTLHSTSNPSPYLYRATPGGMVDRESLRNNLEAIAESLRELSEAVRNHSIDLESMMPEAEVSSGEGVRS